MGVHLRRSYILLVVSLVAYSTETIQIEIKMEYLEIRKPMSTKPRSDEDSVNLRDSVAWNMILLISSKDDLAKMKGYGGSRKCSCYSTSRKGSGEKDVWEGEGVGEEGISLARYIYEFHVYFSVSFSCFLVTGYPADSQVKLFLSSVAVECWI